MVWPLHQLDEKTQELVSKLRDNWSTVRAEGDSLRSKVKWPQEVGLVDKGSWNYLQLARLSGGKNGLLPKQEVCETAKTTCDIVNQSLNSHKIGGCQTCTVLWSILGPHTRLKPHCGPTNARLFISFYRLIIKHLVCQKIRILPAVPSPPRKILQMSWFGPRSP